MSKKTSTITNRKSALQKIRRETGLGAKDAGDALDREFDRVKDWDKATTTFIGTNKPDDEVVHDGPRVQIIDPKPTMTPEDRAEAIKNGELPYEPGNMVAGAEFEQGIYHPHVIAMIDGVSEQVFVGKPSAKEKVAIQRAEKWISDYEKLDEAGRRKALGWKPLAKEPKAKTKRESKPRAPKKDGQLSQLDAAAKVLGSAKKPLNVKDILARAEEQKLWERGEGKTPENTLYASILREVNTKGKESRFKKAGAGLWTLA